MNPHSGTDYNNNRRRRTKAIAAAIPIAGVIVAAALLSGLSLINSYQPAIAQQNMTAGNATITTTDATGGNQSEIRLLIEEALTALQNNNTQGALMNLCLALNALGGNITTTAGFIEVEDEGGIEVEAG